MNTISPASELLRWHHRLGHLSFLKLRILIKLGILPKRLLTVKAPMCASCKAGQMTKKPVRVKGASKQNKIKQVSSPGECVSVDQSESRTPGFIGVLKGFLTKKRYTYSTIFVDHYSGYTYVHLQTSTNSEETVKAKDAFENILGAMNVQVKHYHADNGRFCQKGFMQSIREKEQTISFCGVSAHFQNGKAKKRIRDLQDQARKMLLHAIAKWPQANTTHLWPYALAHAANVANHLPTGPDGNSSLELSSGTEVRPKLKHFHTFGCPVFALDSRLQDGKFTPKCNPRCRISLYLGNSPRHARSISLVLYLDTAHVSPHFHVAHDEFFETVERNGSPKS